MNKRTTSFPTYDIVCLIAYFIVRVCFITCFVVCLTVVCFIVCFIVRVCVFHRALLRVFHRFVHRPLSLNPQLHASPTARLKSAIDQSPFGHRLPSKFFGSTFFLLRVRS